MSEKITCFLPCRAGSERVPKKNIRDFAGIRYGLLQIKLEQLLDVEEIDEVVLSTNDLEVIDFVSQATFPKIRLHQRDIELARSSTSTDDLVAHALELIPEGSILWTHVTSPFANAECYRHVIASYLKCRTQGFDSLMTTTALRSFLWKDGRPINYDRTTEKWPRTQTLAPVHEVNSAAFLAHSDIYRRCNDRIGERPYLLELDALVGFDIDWPEDFVVAECLYEKGLASL